MNKERNLKYELRFRKYLYSFDFDKHKDICKNINLKHNEVKE